MAKSTTVPTPSSDSIVSAAPPTKRRFTEEQKRNAVRLVQESKYSVVVAFGSDRYLSLVGLLKIICSPVLAC